MKHRVNFSYVNPVLMCASQLTRKNMLTVSCDTSVYVKTAEYVNLEEGANLY